MTCLCNHNKNVVFLQRSQSTRLSEHLKQASIDVVNVKWQIK